MGTFVNEAVSVPGSVSGSEVINDLLDRVAEKLSKSCNLRQSDSYAGYTATVTVPPATDGCRLRRGRGRDRCRRARARTTIPAHHGRRAVRCRPKR
jgi:hypothetical protein